MTRCVVALDVGGSSVKSSLVIDRAPPETVRTSVVDSSASADRIGAAFAEIIAGEVAQARELGLLDESNMPVPVGIGFPGPTDYERGVAWIRGLAKFDRLYGKSIVELIRKHSDPAVQLRIRMRNDAEAAIVGESAAGAGVDAHYVLGITLGTGIGSAHVRDGAPFYPSNPHHDEGWIYPWPVGDRRADDVFSIRGLRDLALSHGCEASEPRELAERAQEGEATARKIFEEFGRRLGRFLAEVEAYYTPDRFVVLGGIARSHDLFLPSALPLIRTELQPGKLRAAALLGAALLF